MSRTMIPEANNVYGVIFSPAGLDHVLSAVVRVHRWAHAEIRTSSFSGESFIRLHSEMAEFESQPLPEPSRHLFNGAVGGTADEAAKFVRELSEALEASHIKHRLEVYDNEDAEKIVVFGRLSIWSGL